MTQYMAQGVSGQQVTEAWRAAIYEGYHPTVYVPGETGGFMIAANPQAINTCGQTIDSIIVMSGPVQKATQVLNSRYNGFQPWQFYEPPNITP